MKCEVVEWFKMIRRFLLGKLRLHRPNLAIFTSQKENPPTQIAQRDPFSSAYRLLGDRTERVLPLFAGLDSDLSRSSMKVNFKVYVSLAVTAAILLTFVTALIVPFLAFFVFSVRLFPAILFGVGMGLFALAFSILGFILYPVYRADKLRRELEDELPFTAGYMTVLASAGVSPENIFYSLSTLPVPLTASLQAKDVVRDVDLFGQDILSALAEISTHTPSEKFREMIEGFISTIHSGGSMEAFLRQKTKQFMRLRRIGLRRFSDTLSMLSEFYVAIFITGPLLLVIMLAVMAMLGGSSFGILSPDLMLSLLTYVALPLGSVAFLIVLDSISPKW